MATTPNTCTYREANSDGWGTTWKTQCGKQLYCQAPEEVGMSFAPLPNKDGEYCHFCGKKIQLVERK